MQRIKYILHLHSQLQNNLVHGVMVTLLFLVQSFKVRVLVNQQKNPTFSRGIFYFTTTVITYILNAITGLFAWFTKSSEILPFKK